MPLSLGLGTHLDYGNFLIAVLALWLLCAALSSIGLFVSSLSRSTAFAALGSFVVSFMLWIIHVANDSANQTLQSMISYISLQKHFNSLLSGAFSSADLIYFVLLCLLFLFFTVLRLDAIRSQQ